VYQYSDKIYLLNDSKLAEMPSLEVAKDIMQKNKAFV
jgi:ABC-2 type transport system ATP-binding protein